MSDDKPLAGRVAIVTGSARNIGCAIALELARAGASVVVNARGSAEAAAAVVADIEQAGGRAIVKLADITDPKAVDGLVATTVDRFGGLDILVNNAAIRREADFADLDYAQWREIMAILLDAPYLCAHAALPHLRRSSQATIVNIGGLTAHTGSARRAHVVTAKAGLVGLTRALAHDLAPLGVTVNCVVPGMIDTARLASSTSGGTPAHHAGHLPLVGRKGRPEEIAALVAFLCGEDARYITGQTLHANGGLFFS